MLIGMLLIDRTEVVYRYLFSNCPIGMLLIEYGDYVDMRFCATQK